MQLFWKIQRKIIFSMFTIVFLFIIYATAQENDTSASVVTGEEVSNEEVSSEDAASEEVTSEDAASEEVTSEETASEEVTSEDVTSEEVTSEEVTSEEAASEEVTSEEEKENLFSTSLELGYVGPDVWAGFRVSNGTRIQPLLKFTVWDFGIGIFWNIYGSEKDRMVNTQPPPDYLYGKYTKGLGMCDDVEFFIEWGHDWDWFSLSSDIWLMAYTWKNNRFGITATDKSICKWFGNNTSAALSITPSINLGPFSIYNMHWVDIMGRDREVLEDEKWVTKNPIGDYRGTLGFTYSANPVERYSFELGAYAEWANKKFLREWLESNIKAVLRNRNDLPYGIYHITVGASSSFDVLPQLSISGNFNVEFITNHWIRINDVKTAKGCIPYGGLHLSYSFGW